VAGSRGQKAVDVQLHFIDRGHHPIDLHHDDKDDEEDEGCIPEAEGQFAFHKFQFSEAFLILKRSDVAERRPEIFAFIARHSRG